MRRELKVEIERESLNSTIDYSQLQDNYESTSEIPITPITSVTNSPNKKVSLVDDISLERMDLMLQILAMQ